MHIQSMHITLFYNLFFVKNASSEYNSDEALN